MQQIRLWDLPTRLFHWLLVAAIAAAWASGEAGSQWIIWHGRIGLFIVGLVAFRLTWGFLGSTYARFTTFVRGPKSILAYLRGDWKGLGHNPLGALSVLGLLALVALQAGLGLFATNDDIGYNGFLQALVTSDLSAVLTRFHHKIFDVLLVLIGLHVAAILFYAIAKKEDLVRPMFTGKKAATGESAQGGGLLSLVLALAVAALAVWAASGAWLPPPPPQAPASTQNW